MIDINLLPIRYRQTDSTPARIGIAVLVGVIVVCIAGFLNAYFMLVKLTEAKSINAGLVQEIASLQGQIEKKKNVKNVLAAQTNRRETVAKLFKSRLLLAPRLSRLQDTDFLTNLIQISALDFGTTVKTASQGKSGALVRLMKIDGVVRSPGGEDQLPRDDQRMNTLSEFVRNIETDPVFFESFSGTVQYYRAVVRDEITEKLYMAGNPDPFKEQEIPVYLFGISITSVFEETPQAQATPVPAAK